MYQLPTLSSLQWFVRHPRRATVSSLLLAAAIVCGCARNSAPDISADARAERIEVLAPIESAEIVVRESFPPQYAVYIVSGLPSGCAEFARIDVERAARTIDVTVWNTMPGDRATPCTMIYRTAQNTVRLEGAFAADEAYVLNVNGVERLTFVAQ